MGRMAVGDTTDDGRTYSSLVVRVPVDLHVAIKQRAADQELSLAQAVRRALRLYLEEHEPA